MERYSPIKLHYTKPNNHGFTMIEMIVVLIVMAIMGTVIAYKYIPVKADVSAETEILKSSLRFAQIKALDNAVDNDTWGIIFTSGGTSYTYYRNNEVAYYYDKNGDRFIDNLPGECGNITGVCISSPTHMLPSGMTITGSAANFDKWGKNPDGNDINIVLNQGVAAVATIKVTKYTGHIQ